MKMNNEWRVIWAYMLVALIVSEICPASSANLGRDIHANTKTRHKRQAADILLMKLKAKGALGTTRPSDFFRRIGKKRDSPYSKVEAYVPAVASYMGGEGYIQEADYPQRW